MFQVIHPPYKKVTLACIACLCFEIGECPWPDLSALFQYTSLTPVVSLHLIPRIKYHQGIPVTLLTGSSSNIEAILAAINTIELVVEKMPEKKFRPVRQYTFLYIYSHFSSLGRFTWIQHNDHPPVGFLVQLVERCICIVEVMGSNPERA